MRSIPFDALHDEVREDWFDVVCHENNRAEGTVRVRLRELPDKEFQRLKLLHNTSWQSALTATRTLNAGESPLEAISLVETKGGELVEVSDKKSFYQKELISKMVIDHDPSSFRVEFPARASEAQIRGYLEKLGVSSEDIDTAIQTRVAELPFVEGQWLYKEKPQPGAGPETLRAYAKSEAFLHALYNACLRHQELRWLEPEQVWAEAAKTQARYAKTVNVVIEEKHRAPLLDLLAACGLSPMQRFALREGGTLVLTMGPGEEEDPLA